VADVDGEVVGCNHYLVMQYQLGRGISVKGLAAGDLLVKSDLRRHHVATDLSMEGRRIVTAAHPEADFVAMFTWRSLGAYFEGLLGYVKVRPGYRQWSKRLTWDGHIDRLLAANPTLVAKHPGLARVDHTFRLEIDGSPDLVFHVGPKGFRPVSVPGAPALRVKVSNPGGLAAAGSLMSLARALAARRIRVSGSPRAMRQALSIAGAYLAVAQMLKRD
jgi:hypothetical protein